MTYKVWQCLILIVMENHVGIKKQTVNHDILAQFDQGNVILVPSRSERIHIYEIMNKTADKCFLN